MISAIAKDAGDRYEIETIIKGSAGEVDAEVRSILRGIWRENYGPMIIDSILEQFVEWVKEQH